MKRTINLTINGEGHTDEVEPRLLLHEEFGDNIAFRMEVPNPAVDQALKEAGTLAKAMERAKERR